MIVAATGHRPEKLGGYDEKTRRALGALATEWLHYARPDKVISGMALGWDQAVAAACVVLGIPFIAAVPFEGQDRKWPQPARERYWRLIEKSESVEIMNPTNPLHMFDVPRMMQLRNEWMVDRANKMLALWDGSWGGTFNCLEYARKKGVEVENLWAKWSLPEEDRSLIG